MSLDARPVDPRTIEWSRAPAAFQVRIWRAASAPTSEMAGWRSEDWEVDGGDVKEALRWAEEHAAGAPFTLSAVIDDVGERGEVLLHGTDPTRR